MRRLYHKSGYINAAYILHSPVPFTFVVGGRGIGKTYGVLEDLYRNDIPYIYMRRTQSQIEIAMTPEFSPWAAIPNVSRETIFRTDHKITSLYKLDGEEPQPEPHAIGLSLSTFSNIRGINAPRIRYIIYDEFIPEPRERLLKDEAGALMNAYETINRNRELEGEPPLKLVCLANSNRIDNPVLQGWRLVDIALKMQETGQEVHTIPERGIRLIRPTARAVSEAKRETALYKATTGTKFSKMALNNAFQTADVPVHSRSLDGLVAVWCLGRTSKEAGDDESSVTIYAPKATNGRWYITHHLSGTPEYFGTDPESLARFRRAAKVLPILDYNKMVDYEEYSCYTTLREIADW